ncbi:UNKNOWN [Stylonychia lemnae]|uniref:Uncharacterized protein n=1 Tax=Stylonychia lemnae TaxID=5949 RepID=A0A078AKE3_STYLE|nr:UNKNOWN [Stylonychia lemnae]|eukprot:CDW81288.1 UNKNOWN [Stylonychia lemnae]
MEDQDSILPQFNYLNLTSSSLQSNKTLADTDRIKTIELASESLLKEIGVDIEKFLSKDSFDSFESYRSQYTIPKPSLNSSAFVLPSLSDLSQLTPPDKQAYPKSNSNQNFISSQGSSNNTISTATGQVQSNKILDMKFRQMNMNRYMPTDEEKELFQENHKLRMQRIEERFKQNIQIEQNVGIEEEIDDKVQVLDENDECNQNYGENTNQTSDIKIVEAVDQDNMEKMFQKSLSKKQAQVIEADEEAFEDDMQIQDLSDDEYTQNQSKFGKEIKLVQKSKEQSDYENQLKAIKILIERDQAKQQLEQLQNDDQEPSVQIDTTITSSKQQVTEKYLKNEDDEDFDGVDDILDFEESKKYEVIRTANSNNQHSLQIFDNEQNDQIGNSKFREYMSWQTGDSQSVNNQDAVQILDVKFPDPYMIHEERQAFFDQEYQAFKYNEHGIYSDNSEDEEAEEIIVNSKQKK